MKPENLHPPGIVLTAAQANALNYGQGAMYHRSSGLNSDPGWEAKRDAGLGITPLPTLEVTHNVKTEVSDSGFTSTTHDYRTQIADVPETIHTQAAGATIKPSHTASTLLQTAGDTLKQRGVQYDKPEGERSMGATVKAFNAVTGLNLTESHGWLLMSLLKMVRDNQREAAHEDSCMDLIAYASLYAEARLK